MIRYVALFACCVCQLAYPVQQYDHVASVTVNGEEITKPLAFRQWKKILGRSQSKISSVLFSECTGNHEVTLAATNPVVRLEYYPEDNRNTDLGKLFESGTAEITKDGLRARVWIEWRSLKAIRQEIKVGDMAVSEGVRAETFAAHFPLSFRKGGSGKGEEVVFEVLFGVVPTVGETGFLEEAPPYTPSIQFFFNKGRLQALKVLQGVGC